MAKIIAMLLLLIAFLALPNKIFALEIAGSSANLVTTPVLESRSEYVEKQLKRRVIRDVLEKHNSPLASEVDAFLNACSKYKIDCYLLPSISGLESSYGKKILHGSNNPFGWGGGYILFDSWSDGFHAVARGLRNNYYNRGASSIETIAPIYAESKTWAVRVRSIHSQFEKKEKELMSSIALMPLSLP